MERFKPYFPSLPDACWQHLSLYANYLREWNEKVNLIARSDIEFLEEKHILPVLAFKSFGLWKGPLTVLDVGTGGGIPGIPLAILYPDIRFMLLDSIHKKIRAVQSMVTRLNLPNVHTCCERLECHSPRYDAIVGRFVMAFDKFVRQTRSHLRRENCGIYYWSGGEVASIVPESLLSKVHIFDLEKFYSSNYCLQKKIFHFQP